MVAYTFDARQYQPQYGGGDGGLPDGLYKTVIVQTRKVDVEKMGQAVGSYLELTHSVIEGNLRGQTQIDRLNLHHTNPTTVEIANKQLSAYCHVLGVFAFTDTQQLCNIPMGIEVGRQVDKTTKQPTAYGEIKKVFDANGNEAGKAGTGPAPQQQQQQQPPPQQPPPAGVQAEGGGWGGGVQAEGGGWGGGGTQQQPPPQQQQQQPPADGGNWGAPAGGQQQPPPQQQQQPPPQQAGGGWAPQQQASGPAAWGPR